MGILLPCARSAELRERRGESPMTRDRWRGGRARKGSREGRRPSLDVHFLLLPLQLNALHPRVVLSRHRSVSCECEVCDPFPPPETRDPKSDDSPAIPSG